jgi:hypothetical protein
MTLATTFSLTISLRHVSCRSQLETKISDLVTVVPGNTDNGMATPTP